MGYTLGEAAKATGKTKPAIAKAIANGRVSAAKDDLGKWQIDPAELHRVYPPVSSQVGDSLPQVDGEIDGLRERLADKDAVIDDLRRRLDQSEQERRDKDRQLTALLTDQRAKEVPEPKAGTWWGFWRSRR